MVGIAIIGFNKLGKELKKDTWGISGFNGVKITRYLCCECGYSEEWVDNKKDIENLQRKFE